ncbi:hypothetical protein TeGR_g7045 [Tetraparma gracilis]|uniref:Uncharacterized protein n=1 Tax=Tetraparma gracilis TaxID=2962635 RepID=A0ABQ6MFC1_9STRA|nr:hypothetical protein TeGR_g7045 [Tetraparma gracilis]
MADILADVIVSQITETASSNTQISRAGIGRTASDRARARAASEASTASDRHEAMVRFSKRWACSFAPPLSTSDADQKDATTNPLGWVLASCLLQYFNTSHWLNVAFAAVESTVTFTIYLLVDIGSALVFLLFSTDWFQARKVTRKGRLSFAFEKKTNEENIEFALDKRFDKLFNVTMFSVIQFAELWFAVFTAALFYVLRNGPNGDNTALGPHRLSADNYARLNQFLFLVIASEVFTSIMLFSFGIKKVGIDPRPYIGEYLGAHSLAGMHLMPLILQLPIVLMMFDHASMGFKIGE